MDSGSDGRSDAAACAVCGVCRARLASASGFFFERDGRLFLVTSRHVLIDEPSKHFPDRIEIELHFDAHNLAQSVRQSLPLYRAGQSVWRQGEDSGGEIEVAVLELDRAALPAPVATRSAAAGRA